jgi:hypothetical protein
MIAIGMDAGLLLRSIHESLAAVSGDRRIRSGFQLEHGPRPRFPSGGTTRE